MKPEYKRIKLLITVKTHPIPSKKYDELVCTAGVTETGEFIRLYPINFRELPYEQQYKKYQWIEVDVAKHSGQDSRKESYRPNCDTLKTLGRIENERSGDWTERARYVLRNKAKSIEDLRDRQAIDKTSLGIFKPKSIEDLTIQNADPEWPEKFRAALQQQRLFETRKNTLVPPRKVPYCFKYKFCCDDSRCTGHHLMIEDWEVGALYWNLIDNGYAPSDAANAVKQKFFRDIAGPDKDLHFFVGTIAAHPKTWVIIGTFYPKKGSLDKLNQTSLF